MESCQITLNQACLCVVIALKRRITVGAAFLKRGPLKGLHFLRGRQSNALHLSHPAAPQAGPWAGSGPASSHRETQSRSGASQGPRHRCPGNRRCQWGHLTLPVTPASTALMQKFREPAGKSKQAGWCSAHRGRGKEKLKTLS